MSAAHALAALARPNTAAHRRVCQRFITAGDGVRLNYTDDGDPTARCTVVFLHGLCLSRASWIRQISYLAHRYSGAVRVVSYDHRGHGQSQPAPVSTYRPEQRDDDLAQVITQLEITGSVTLLGHSLGAMVALSYLARQSHDRRVDPEGLVLVATAAGRLAERGLGRLLAIPGIDGLSRFLEHAPQQALRTLSAPACTALGRCWGYSSAQRAALAAVASAALMTTPTATVVGFLPALRDFNTHLSLQAIRARTVVISGSADPITPPVHSRELAAQIPDAVHVCVPGAGHMLAQQAPHVVASAIDHVISPRSEHTGRRRCQFPLNRAVLREQGGPQ